MLSLQARFALLLLATFALGLLCTTEAAPTPSPNRTASTSDRCECGNGRIQSSCGEECECDRHSGRCFIQVGGQRKEATECCYPPGHPQECKLVQNNKPCLKTPEIFVDAKCTREVCPPRNPRRDVFQEEDTDDGGGDDDGNTEEEFEERQDQGGEDEEAHSFGGGGGSGDQCDCKKKDVKCCVKKKQVCRSGSCEPVGKCQSFSVGRCPRRH
jgi:hypothetical protein